MRYTISQAEVLLLKAIALPLHKNNVPACKKRRSMNGTRYYES